VVVAWVFFRSTTIEGAGGMLAGMAGANGADNGVLGSFLADPRLWGVGSPILVAFVAVAMPNSMWLVKQAERMLTENRRLLAAGAGALTGVAGLVALIFIGAQNEFLYFQF
jgi:hypothetical protein